MVFFVNVINVSINLIRCSNGSHLRSSVHICLSRERHLFLCFATEDSKSVERSFVRFFLCNRIKAFVLIVRDSISVNIQYLFCDRIMNCDNGIILVKTMRCLFTLVKNVCG